MDSVKKTNNISSKKIELNSPSKYYAWVSQETDVTTTFDKKNKHL